jgi:hypothetical protein
MERTLAQLILIISTLGASGVIGMKRESAVFVFEAQKNHDSYMKFQREWLSLGTPDAGRYFDYTRTIKVH